MNHESAPPPDPAPHHESPASESVADLLRSLESAVQELKARSKAFAALARELAKVAKPATLYDAKKLEVAHGKLQSKIDPRVAHAAGLAPILDALAAYVAAAPERLRRELGRSLKQACVAERLEFRVVGTEAPVEVRIPPLSVLLDFQKSQAVFQYARDPIATSRLAAEDILKTYHKTVSALERGFAPEAFFANCHAAYQRVLRIDKLPAGDRVELLRFLPELAFLLQSRRFQTNPTQKNYRPYSRARFAYDVHRLRKAGGLVQNGLRINFGVATGVTASQKSRVIYMEDPIGVGEYKLTVFFTKA